MGLGIVGEEVRMISLALLSRLGGGVGRGVSKPHACGELDASEASGMEDASRRFCVGLFESDG